MTQWGEGNYHPSSKLYTGHENKFQATLCTASVQSKRRTRRRVRLSDSSADEWPVRCGGGREGSSWEKRSAHPPPARVITRAFKCLWPRESTGSPTFFPFSSFSPFPILSQSISSLPPPPPSPVFPPLLFRLLLRTNNALLRSLCSFGISIPFETRLRFRLVGEWKRIIGRRRPR